ncbi:MAG TPA: styrene monooxygenase/indole monooxygenase family protein [Myxococcaceae bacterium]|nr:styrene monooxygenase/indole monooxygenase family protein [Myxococcaceae bacterium]
MRRIAIVGSGIAGLLTAHGLRRAGHEVTLYSDRTPRQWLEESTPTGVAGRFHRALSYDRELGLAHWDDNAASIDGVALAFCAKPRNQFLTLNGRTSHRAMGIDVRAMSARWMEELEQRGGKVVIEPVDVGRLDAIAAQNDLTIVGVGKADLCNLFERNAARSVYTRPQRNLCMAIMRGRPVQEPGETMKTVRYMIVEPYGEAFWMPFVHKTGEALWAILFEAKPGSRMDRFGDVKSGDQALARLRELMRELFPWASAWLEPFTLADPRGWLVGAVTPTVRDPVGKLPSGRVVTGVGDTLMVFDPIGGQGANNGTRMAKHLVTAVNARGDGPFDAEWMTRTFESFWENDARHHWQFNNLLLEPMTGPGRLLMMAGYGSDGVANTSAQRVANAFADNFDDARTFTPALLTAAAARKAIAGLGGHWATGLLRGVTGAARGQLLQAMGRQPGHPTAAAAL